MFPRKFVDYNTSSCAYSHTKRHVSTRFLTYKDMSLRYLQHLTPFLSPNFPLMYLKRCTHDFNLQLLHTVQLLTYKTSLRVNFHIGGHVCMSISVCHLILMFYLNYHVSTQCVDYQTCLCACSRTKRRVCAHFLTHEVMSMRNFKHITPCLSHNFSQVHSKQSTTSRLFNL